ncbi:hypothetical protein JCM11641_002476 [Rhodosporidiobolus odoratus]
MPSHAQLQAALAQYPRALSLRAHASKASKDLVELDEWSRVELRDQVSQRRKENGEGTAFLTREELGKVMTWKLARGKFRPRLQDLVLSNPASLVESTTSSSSLASPADALTQLCTLKGIGPATASAILALWHPEDEPFMSDESLEHCEAYGEDDEGKGKRDYTVKAWKTLRTHMQERKEKEEWASMEDLEKALWSWAVERKYGGQAGTKEKEVNVEEPKKPSSQKRASTSTETSAPHVTKKRKS